MRSIAIVVLLPISDVRLRLCEGRKQGFVQQFIAKAPDEAFGERVLGWLARRDVVPADTGLLTPSQHSHAGQFCAVVAYNRLRPTSARNDCCELPCDADTGHGSICNQAQAFPAEVIHDGQHAEATAFPCPADDCTAIGERG